MSAKPPSTQLDIALAACRSIRFAVAQAERHGGDFSLTDILAANRLAVEAMRWPAARPAGTTLPRRSIKKGRS